MQANRWLVGVLVLLMLSTPVLAWAQGDDEMEMVDFVSDDERFSLTYPADWFVGVDDEVPFPNVVLANQEDLPAEIIEENDPVLESGQVGIVLLLLPTDFLPLIGIEWAEDATMAESATSIVEALMDSQLSDPASTLELGEALEIEFDDERTAALVPITEEESEGTFVVAFLAEDLLVLGLVRTAPDELTEEWVELLAMIVESVSFEGTGADLMLEVLGGAAVEEEALDGAALVAERCSVCHTLDRVNNATKDEAGWTATVDRMIGNGAQLNAAEREAVIAYLSSR